MKYRLKVKHFIFIISEKYHIIILEFQINIKMQHIKTILVNTLLLGLIIPQVVWAGFSDIQNSNYQNAIQDLQTRNIIEGYEDGTFKPGNKIARSELTKIIIESLKIPQSNKYKCFSDIDITQWYPGYVCKAKELGWVEGYDDGTFRPGAYIARSEALKIMAKAGEWSVQEYPNLYNDTPAGLWFTGFATTAKNRNFLPYDNSFQPSNEITREEFAEIYHRIIVTKENSASKYQSTFSSSTNTQPPPTNNDEEPQINNVTEIPTNQTGYTIDTFEHATLSEALPNNFYVNEVYLFNGKLNNTSYETGFAFFYPENSRDQITRLPTKTENGDFSIPLVFKESGTYYLGLIPGTGGSSNVAQITVYENLPSTTNTPTENTSGNYIKPSFDTEHTYMNFSSNKQFHQIELSQGDQSVTYYNRQGITKIPVLYSDFQNFNKGSINVSISAADAESYFPLTNRNNWETLSNGSFYGINHFFSEISSEIDLNQIPLSFNNQVPINFSGTTNLEIRPTLNIIVPDGVVEELSVGNQNYQAGDIFQYSYTPSENKIYIFEVNKPDGISAINHPVYPINQIPILPDHLDLSPLTLVQEDNFNEQAAINKMLILINEARTQHGLDPVVNDIELNSLARGHSQDMLTNDYLEHINLDGQSPNDRRIAAGIQNYVGENIALTSSVEHGHNGFMRSAIHRDNILTPEWTKVGLSILKNAEGYIYITQEFSFSSIDFLTNVQDTISDYNLSNSNDLNDLSLTWSEKMRDEDFFATTSPNGDTMNQLFSQSGIQGVTEARIYILKGSSTSSLVSNIESLSELNDNSWTDRGVGIALSDIGDALLTIFFAK